MSDNKELYKALLKYQQKGITVGKNATNPFHKNKYATLDHIYKEVVPALNACGLVLTQEPSYEDGSVFVTTRVTHADTGTSISCQAGCAVDGKAQDVGSAITYLRRYGFSLVGLVTDDDDDGNAAGKPKDKKEPSGKNAEQNKEDGMRKKIKDVVHTIVEGDNEQKAGVLAEITKDKKGGSISTSAEIDALTGKTLGWCYAMAKTHLESWEAAHGPTEDDGSTMTTDSDGNTEFNW